MSGANTEFARLRARTQLIKHGPPFVESGFNGRKNPKKGENGMKQERGVLIVSCRPENRKTLVRILDELSINSYVAPTIRDARELLGSRSLSMVFCEERFSDGPYCDLLRDVRPVVYWRTGRIPPGDAPRRPGGIAQSAAANGCRSRADPSDERERPERNGG